MIDKDNIKILLCRTWTPGNIGSSLRSMKNFDFRNVVAVNQIHEDDEEMKQMAAGAKDHIKYLKKSSNLLEELKDCNVIYAFTNRERRFFKTMTPADMAQEISSLAEGQKVGLLFGNETNGLNCEEIDLADKIVTIPTSEHYASLNLASAVLLALFEIHKVSLEDDKSDEDKLHQIIPLKEQISLFETVSSVVCNKIIDKISHRKQFEENVKFLIKRMSLSSKESRFIKSLFKMIERKLDRK